MNELTTLLAKAEIDRTAIQNDAIRVHERVVMDRQMVICGLSNLCRDLKEIRDMRYYATLGYSDFGQYTEEQHGIGERQAYKYIRIMQKLVKSIIDEFNLFDILCENHRDELQTLYEERYDNDG